MTSHSTVVHYPHDSWRIGYYRWMMTPMWKSVRIRIAMAVLALIFRSAVLHVPEISEGQARIAALISQYGNSSLKNS
jgi:hypothetical protein